MNKKQIRICSACLLGVKCRYDGSSKANTKLVQLSKKGLLIPVCPEQLAGFGIPREAAEQKGRRVITKSGKDVTKQFEKGAREVLKIAKMLGAKEAILKQRSPSCGFGQIYDGTFTGKVIKGDGVTARLLKKNGIKIVADDTL